MSWLRRRSKADPETEGDDTSGAEPGDDASSAADDTEAPSAPNTSNGSSAAAVERTEAAADAETRRREQGPFDLSEADADDRRIDLGALQLPGRQGMELRLEVEDSTKRVIAVTVAMGTSTLQMQVFAAPRTFGVWDDVRSEIAAEVTRQGGTADEVPGAFGRELIARIPVRTPEGRSGHRPSRFVGVDGPRWFLRGVFGGPAAHDHAAAAPLEDVLRSAVVVRGSEAMAPRDLLVLRLPTGATPAATQAEPGDTVGSTGKAQDDLAPFERGPEITERR